MLVWTVCTTTGALSLWLSLTNSQGLSLRNSGSGAMLVWTVCATTMTLSLWLRLSDGGTDSQSLSLRNSGSGAMLVWTVCATTGALSLSDGSCDCDGDYREKGGDD